MASREVRACEAVEAEAGLVEALLLFERDVVDEDAALPHLLLRDSKLLEASVAKGDHRIQLNTYYASFQTGKVSPQNGTYLPGFEGVFKVLQQFDMLSIDQEKFLLMLDLNLLNLHPLHQKLVLFLLTL